MKTVLYVSEMTLGDEVPVHRIHQDFPIETLERGLGVERLVAFIGSGYYALEITVGGPDDRFQENFHRFLAAPEVQDLFRALAPYVKHLPAPTEGTAAMPLMSAMLLWQRPGLADATTV